jgi:predicted metalloprotease
VVREALFTHGSAESRAYWFTQGLKSGDLEAMMKTFEVPFDQLDPKKIQ